MDTSYRIICSSSSIMLLITLMSIVSIAIVQAAPHSKHDSNRPEHNHRKYAHILHGIGAYKRKLQEQGLINSIDEQLYESPEDYIGDFNELEMLQLIPIIIGELQANRIDAADRSLLHSVFGSLWPLMVDEADRRQRKRAARSMLDGRSSREAEQQQWPPIDPVLKSIIRAQRDHDAMLIDTYQPYGGGRNPVASEHSMTARLMKVWNEQNGNVEPSQRILKLAAILIHEQMMRRQNRAQRKTLRKHANAMARELAAATAAVAAAEAAAGEDDEDTTLLRVRMARSAHRRKRATATEAKSEKHMNTETDGSEDDGDYSYFDASEENGTDVANARAMFDDASEFTSDNSLEDDTMDDWAGPFDRFGGSVTELFALAERHRLRKQRNRNYLHKSRGY